VGLIASCGRSIRQVADDLGLGLPTLTRWKREQRSFEVATNLVVLSLPLSAAGCFMKKIMLR
jgi:hypothetical protein